MIPEVQLSEQEKHKALENKRVWSSQRETVNTAGWNLADGVDVV